jgi:hypothetical protein
MTNSNRQQTAMINNCLRMASEGIGVCNRFMNRSNPLWNLVNVAPQNGQIDFSG